jgi:hypothetical protein
VDGVRRVSVFEVVAPGETGWWLVVDQEHGGDRVVAGPFADRLDASWVAGTLDEAAAVYGVGRPDGGLDRRPSPEDRAWFAHLDEQLGRLPEDWDADLPDDDDLGTLVVEVTAALVDAGLSLHDPAGALGGVCLTPEVALAGVLVGWRQHDRMCVDRVHGPQVGDAVQRLMNRTLADVLELRGFTVDPFGASGSSVVRFAG